MMPAYLTATDRKDPTYAAGVARVNMVQQRPKCLRAKWPKTGHEHRAH
jgi:hypothetical protein